MIISSVPGREVRISCAITSEDIVSTALMLDGVKRCGEKENGRRGLLPDTASFSGSDADTQPAWLWLHSLVRTYHDVMHPLA
jgi:hypothetical protein